MNRRSSAILMAPLLLCLLFEKGIAFKNNPGLDSLVYAGKNEIYHFRLDSALQIFNTIQQKFPQYPHGYFYEAYITAIYFSQDKTNDSLDVHLHQAVNEAIDIGEKFKDATGQSPESLYYLGLSYGILGIYQVLNRSYLGAYFNGRKGKNYLEQVVEKDSTYYDAYLGLGIFHYYVDLMPGIVKFFAGILGFKGDREKGIHEVLLTAEKGRFFKVEGELTYAGLRYFFEGDYYNQARTFIHLQKRFPENPALPLLIGYHYRRTGSIPQAIYYFKMVDDSFKDKFPQIWIVKYYNLAVCHFFYNDFNKAEEIFDKIIFDTVRKTRYYIAALEFYKGLLADLKYHRKKAERYYTMIRENKDTQYWYHFAKIFREAPVDSFMSRYIRAQNDIYVSNLKEASVLIDQIKAGFEKSPGKIKLPYLIYLTIDLEAQVQYRRRDFESAEKTYRVLSNNISHIKDDFRRDWVYIHYARVLRARKKWEEAEEMLEKAKSSGDEYTNLIVERELFIVSKNMNGSEDTEQ